MKDSINDLTNPDIIIQASFSNRVHIRRGNIRKGEEKTKKGKHQTLTELPLIQMGLDGSTGLLLDGSSGLLLLILNFVRYM